MDNLIDCEVILKSLDYIEQIILDSFNDDKPVSVETASHAIEKIRSIEEEIRYSKKLIDKDTAKMPIRRRNPNFGDEIETFCPNCNLMLYSRDMGSDLAFKLRNHRCADCGQRLASKWWTLRIPITENNGS